MVSNGVMGVQLVASAESFYQTLFSHFSRTLMYRVALGALGATECKRCGHFVSTEFRTHDNAVEARAKVGTGIHAQ
jgi:hypothetical protein